MYVWNRRLRDNDDISDIRASCIYIYRWKCCLCFCSNCFISVILLFSCYRCFLVVAVLLLLWLLLSPLGTATLRPVPTFLRKWKTRTLIFWIQHFLEHGDILTWKQICQLSCQTCVENNWSIKTNFTFMPLISSQSCMVLLHRMGQLCAFTNGLTVCCVYRIYSFISIIWIPIKELIIANKCALALHFETRLIR